MKKKRIAALSLTLAMALSACGGGGGNTQESAAPSQESGGAEKVRTLVDWCDQAHEMENFMILNSEAANDGRVLGNCWEGLLTQDSNSVIQPLIATSYESTPDAKTWTFHLRDDVKWVNYDGEIVADLTAEDFLTGIEWTLNYWKNDAKHVQMLTATIAGAQEYFEYTRDELDQAAGYATKGTDQKFLDTVGVSAPDATTLVFELNASAPYFPSVIMGSCGYPLSQKQVDEMGVEGVLAQNNKTMWYNGPYIIKEFIQGNSKVFEPNPHYWNPDIISFDEVRVVMVEDTNTDDTLFMNGEIDRCTLSESNLRMIYNDESNEWHDNLVQVRDSPFAYQIHLNYNKLNADGSADDNWNKAVNNEAFRQAFRYGVNLEAFWARFNFIDPSSQRLETFTANEVATFSDGTDYADRVVEILGVQDGRYDADKGAAYVAQAKEELAAAGVTFPIECKYYIKAGDQTATDNAVVLEQCIEDCFGKDFVDVVIDTYVTSFSKEVSTLHLQSINTSGWGADYKDPENFLAQLVLNSENAYYASRMDFNNEALPEAKAQWQEFSDMVAAACEISDDLDARYEAQAQAEAYLMDKALIVPLRCPYTAWAMTKENCFTHPRNSYKYVNWDVQSEPYTSAEYEQLWADFNAGK